MVEKILEKASEMLKNNIDLELVEIKDSSGFGTPRKEGAFMFVNADGESFGTVGGGIYEYKCTLLAKEFLLKKSDGEKVYELNQEAAENIGMVCGGNNTTKFTYLTNNDKSHKIVDELKKKNESKNTVYIFGGGHVSTELKKILRYVGFEYVVWDDRTDFANAERFPDAKEVICASYENVLDRVNITKNDLVVVMTRGHACDYQVEKQVLKSDAYYIGVIGSANKNKTIREKLLSDGYSEKELERVCVPIGFQIAAETPEEIAISIASEIIMYRSLLEKRRKVVEENPLVNIYKSKF